LFFFAADAPSERVGGFEHAVVGIAKPDEPPEEGQPRGVAQHLFDLGAAVDATVGEERTDAGGPGCRSDTTRMMPAITFGSSFWMPISRMSRLPSGR
jgi:hypothetical protein